MPQWEKLDSCEADELINLQNKLFGTTEEIPFNPDDPCQAKWNALMMKVFQKEEEK